MADYIFFASPAIVIENKSAKSSGSMYGESQAFVNGGQRFAYTNPSIAAIFYYFLDKRFVEYRINGDSITSIVKYNLNGVTISLAGAVISGKPVTNMYSTYGIALSNSTSARISDNTISVTYNDITSNANAVISNAVLPSIHLYNECSAVVYSNTDRYDGNIKVTSACSAIITNDDMRPGTIIPTIDNQYKDKTDSENTDNSNTVQKVTDFIFRKEVIYTNYYEPLLSVDDINSDIRIIAAYNMPLGLSYDDKSISGVINFVGETKIQVTFSNGQNAIIYLDSKLFSVVDKQQI